MGRPVGPDGAPGGGRHPSAVLPRPAPLLGAPQTLPDKASLSRDSALEPCAGRRRYRVLKIAPTAFFADYGCHVRILEEARALARLGSTVVIATYHAGRDVADVPIRRTPRLPWLDRVQIGSSWHKLYLDALLALRTASDVWTLRPDVVHGHLHEGALIGSLVARLRWRRAPVVFDFQGSLTSEMIDHTFLRRESWLFGPLRWLEERIDHGADAVVTSSHHAVDLLLRAFRCRPERVFALPDGVDTERFRPRWELDPDVLAALRRQLGIPDDRRVVVYLGLLAEYQGATHLLLAAAQLLGRRRDVHFLLMGYPGQERYRATAEALGIAGHVTFTGRLPYEKAPLYLALGDVAVTPKLAATESNGKILNYMALGLPTVAFDTPVSREFLGALGHYAPLGDAGALSEALAAALDDPQADARGRALRARVEEHFSWAALARRLLAVYDLVTR